MAVTALLEAETEEGLPLAGEPVKRAHPSGWTYEEAFKRNLGLINAEEQQKLRNSRVAIAGMGGVGGEHLITLARLGIGKFTIADPDVFEVANFNRQYGATISNLGRNKAEVMAELALDINPELDIRVIKGHVGPDNVDAFLEDADLYADGLDFFAIDARRLVFRKAAEYGIWSITAGPIGFSSAWIAFAPDGMSFDRYFDLKDGMTNIEMLAAFAAGLTPKLTHLPYTDLSYASLRDRTGPSASLACKGASEVLAATTLRVLLDRELPDCAPAFSQFDAYRGVLRRGALRGGNREFLQKIKRRAIVKRFT